jgi:hypothetical protein
VTARRADENPSLPTIPVREVGLAGVGRLGLRVAIGGVAVTTMTVVMLLAPALIQTWQAHQHAIISPTYVDGLAADDGQGDHDTVHRLRHALEKALPLSTTGAVYTDHAAGRQRSVVFVGGTGSLASPQLSLAEALAIISGQTGGIRDVHEIPAGSLGSVKCGLTSTDNAPTAVCGWADYDGLGVAIFPDRDVKQSADLMRAILRAARQRD